MPHSETPVASIGSVSGNSAPEEQTSVNEVVATEVAANIAEAAQLPIAPNVANLSVSLAVKNQIASMNTSATESVTKQQIIQPAGGRRELITYVTKSGDTVGEVAREYGVSKNTILWANDLTSDTLTAKKKLTVLPVDGVLHTVVSGDTAAKLAKKYKTSEARIVAFNDLELTGLKKGAKIIIPAGVLPESERPGYIAPAPSYTFTYPSYSYAGGSGRSDIKQIDFYRSARYPGNTASPGQCTLWAFDRRAEMGRPLHGVLGNASEWAYTLGAQGYKVNKTPAVGAIIQTSAGWAGHVGIVEEVRANGDIVISEMNYINSSPYGSGIVNTAVIKASNVGNWNYIH